jgi:hypothetical protein
MRVRLVGVARVADEPDHLTAPYPLTLRDLRTCALQVPEREVPATTHVQHDVVARRMIEVDGADRLVGEAVDHLRHHGSCRSTNRFTPGVVVPEPPGRVMMRAAVG